MSECKLSGRDDGDRADRDARRTSPVSSWFAQLGATKILVIWVWMTGVVCLIVGLTLGAAAEIGVAGVLVLATWPFTMWVLAHQDGRQ